MKLIVKQKFCVSSLLITEINKSRDTFHVGGCSSYGCLVYVMLAWVNWAGNLELMWRMCNSHCLIEIYVYDRIILKLVFRLLCEGRRF